MSKAKHPYGMPYQNGHMAYKEGRRAGSEGQPIESCPYVRNSIQEVAWITGWEEVQPKQEG